MDKKTIEKVKTELKRITQKHSLEIEKIIVFGSRARGNHNKKSDIDLIIVSKDFKNTPWNQRSREIYLEWNYEKLPEPELICLTPEEFNKKKQKKPHIVNTALEEGIQI